MSGGFHCAYITPPLIIPRSYLAYRFLILFMLCLTNDNNIYAVCLASCQKNLILRPLPAASYYTCKKNLHSTTTTSCCFLLHLSKKARSTALNEMATFINQHPMSLENPYIFIDPFRPSITFSLNNIITSRRRVTTIDNVPLPPTQYSNTTIHATESSWFRSSKSTVFILLLPISKVILGKICFTSCS